MTKPPTIVRPKRLTPQELAARGDNSGSKLPLFPWADPREPDLELVRIAITKVDAGGGAVGGDGNQQFSRSAVRNPRKRGGHVDWERTCRELADRVLMAEERALSSEHAVTMANNEAGKARAGWDAADRAHDVTAAKLASAHDTLARVKDSFWFRFLPLRLKQAINRVYFDEPSAD